MVVARRQALVQLTDALLAALDERAARAGRSRSELIREAVEQYLGDAREREIDEAILAGYRRIPPADLFDTEAAGRDLVAEEPW